MRTRYLLCPQCGLHRLFFKVEDCENIYFHVTWDKDPVPTKESCADLSGCDFSFFHCCGCSWTGGINGLVKYIKY